MTQKFSRWLRSKTGMITLGGIVVLALVVAVVGVQLGWWGGPGAAGTPPDPATCGVVPTEYTVETATQIPFWGIKYVWGSGQKVKSGAADNYSFVVPFDVAQSMTDVTIQARAYPYTNQVLLYGCDFTSSEPCGSQTIDGTKRFGFQFMGAQDNGDGTLTLTFNVQIFTTKPLTHVAISLPDGVVPGSPSASYSGLTCPTP